MDPLVTADWRADVAYLSTEAVERKARHIEHDPPVCLVLVDRLPIQPSCRQLDRADLAEGSVAFTSNRVGRGKSGGALGLAVKQRRGYAGFLTRIVVRRRRWRAGQGVRRLRAEGVLEARRGAGMANNAVMSVGYGFATDSW